MESPATILRDAIDAWRRDEASARVGVWRGGDEASHVARWCRHERLAGDGARELLEQAVGHGELTPDEHGAIVAHLARFAAEGALATARDLLDDTRATRIAVAGEARDPAEIARALVHEPDPIHRGVLAAAATRAWNALAGELLDAREEADERALTWLGGAPRHPDAGPATDELAIRARAFLDSTRDARDELVPWACRDVAIAGEPVWHDLAHAVGRAAAGQLTGSERWRRVGSLVSGLGLARDLSARVRVEPAHGVIDPRARVVAPAPPLDIRIAPSALAQTLVAELTAADAMARALGLALVAPALPVELRRPAVGTVARTLGALVAGLHADRAVLKRERGLGPRDAERIARLATTLVMVDARLAAAAVIARAARASSRAERIEHASVLASEACGVHVNGPLAALMFLTPSGSGSRARARLGALSLAVTLRDRFDEDWYANPRAAEPLRAACARGGALGVEAWCEELGANDAAAASRVLELAGA